MRLSLLPPVSLLGFLGLLLFSPLASAQQKQELSHPKTLQELQQAMLAVIKKDHVPGAGVALVSKGALLWCGGVGKADLTSGRAVTCDTQFRVGSISKTFVALSLLKLEEEGKINLHVRLRDVAPEIPLKNRWESSSPVRIVNLLEHTAGFDDMEPSEVYNLHDRYDYPLLEVFQRFREPEHVRWPPGTRMSYSNPGYGIAGYLIEKITGEPFDRYIREAILRPLDMQVADFPFTPAIKALLATGYDGNPPRPAGFPYIYLRPAGDLKASPDELAKLVQFFLRRGASAETRILKPETIVRMESVETTLAARNGLRLGYGLANYTQVEGGVVTHGHDGGIDGFLSTYRYMPEQNWGYVILINSTASGEALRDLNRLAIDFLSSDYPKPQQPAISLAPAELEKFVGFYSPRAPRDQLLAFTVELFGGLRIGIIDGRLTRSGMFSKPQPLLPVAKNLFRLEKEPEASTVFFSDSSGHMVMTSAGLESFAYGKRATALWPYTRLALLALSFLLMLTSLFFAVFWLVRKLLGKMKEVRHLRVRAVPLFATLSFLLLLFCFTKLSGTFFGTFNIWTAGIFLFSVLFPLLSLYGLWLVVRVPETEIRRSVRIHSYLVSLSCCLVTIFLSFWNLIGLRLWAP